MSSQEIAALLSQRGVRPTQQRIEVYRYLMDHPIHPSADPIYQALSAEYPSFSRRSWAFQVPALRGDIRFSIGSRAAESVVSSGLLHGESGCVLYRYLRPV